MIVYMSRDFESTESMGKPMHFLSKNICQRLVTFDGDFRKFAGLHLILPG